MNNKIKNGIIYLNVQEMTNYQFKSLHNVMFSSKSFYGLALKCKFAFSNNLHCLICHFSSRDMS